MRLFIAVHFSAEVKDVLLQAVEALRAQALSGNFTRPENLHLTLAFIGETKNVAAVRQAMDKVDVPPFVMTVGGFGRFGRLYWAGIEKTPSLSLLALQLHNALRAAGFPVETRDFTPHITLARQVAAHGAVHIAVPEANMTVRHISLMKSERIGGRLTYTELYGRVL